MKTAPVNTDKHENPVDELYALLERQVQMLRNNRYREFEELIEKTNAVTAEIAQHPPPPAPQLNARARQIKKLYNELLLMIEVEKDSVEKQLQKIAYGKRTLQVYQNK